MKGIAFVPVAIILAAAAGTGLLAASMAGGVDRLLEDQPPGNQTGDVGELPGIGAEAARNFPLESVKEFFFEGVGGLVNWISKFLILPLGNWIASMAAGRPVQLPEFVGWIILMLLVLVIFWSKWNRIWNFTLKYATFIAIFLVAIFVVVVALASIGVI